MADLYSLEDQAADLGIHRMHNLVLGDPKREARFARLQTPSVPHRRVTPSRELEQIARRHNLHAYAPWFCQMERDLDVLN